MISPLALPWPVIAVNLLLASTSLFRAEDSTASSAPVAADSLQRGARLFQANCVTCHGPTLARNDPLNFISGVWKNAKSPAEIRRLIEVGEPEKNMPGYKILLRPAQLNDVVAYMLSLSQPSPTP